VPLITPTVHIHRTEHIRPATIENAPATRGRQTRHRSERSPARPVPPAHPRPEDARPAAAARAPATPGTDSILCDRSRVGVRRD